MGAVWDASAKVLAEAEASAVALVASCGSYSGGQCGLSPS